MLASLPATAFAVAALSSVAYGGSSVPIGLYTDINCENPSTLNSNVSLELDTCAVTPGNTLCTAKLIMNANGNAISGLGSVVLNDFPCTSGDVVKSTVDLVLSDTLTSSKVSLWFQRYFMRYRGRFL